jgi:hypothetical protein
MRVRDISELDVRSILKAGTVVDVVPPERTDERWTARGREADTGRALNVVVEVDVEGNTIVVITAYFEQ